MTSGMTRKERRERRRRYEMGGRQNVFDYFGMVARYVLIVLLIMVFITLAGRAYRAGYRMFLDEAATGTEDAVTADITVSRGMTVNQIGELLEQAGIIEDAALFPFQERFSSDHGKIMPGTYTLRSDMTPTEIISTLAGNYSEDEEDGTVSGASSDLGESLREILQLGTS